MNINRHNYEEYFLLYADKELSAEEKNRVESFVQQNPDLKDEFVMLQQSVVKLDNTITLEDKSSLFRKQKFINLDNYEEKFLLYTDNELSLSEIDETEKFSISNPALQNELNLLQQVKCHPDTTIVFPDKKHLYKKENDNKVIPIRWKVMAAAILLGLGLWTGISYLQKNKMEPVVATKKTISPVEKIIVKAVEPKEDVKKYLLVKTEKNQNRPTHKTMQNANDNLVKKQHQQNIIVKNIQLSNKKTGQNKILEKKDEVVIINKPLKKNEVLKTNDLTQPGNTILETTDKNVNKLSSLQNNYAHTTPYIADAELKSDNYVFYNITAEEFKKSKIGNFLKKVKRAIERKTPLKNAFKTGKAAVTTDEN